MRANTASVALAAAVVPAVYAALDKPVIDPEFPGGGLGGISQGLIDNIPGVVADWDDWEAGWIAQDCKTLAEGSGFSTLDITTFNIHYADCPDAWVFCRHKDSPLSQASMVDTFGRVPVGLRSYIRHMIALPGTESAGSAGDNVQMNGNLEITVYVHEIAHSVDGHAFDPSLGQPFSNGQVWLDNYNQDSAVPDSYAQSSQQENFAQQTVVALYDKVVPGGIGNIQPNWNAIFHQFATVQGYLGDKLLPGGTCSGRLTNSEPVAASSSAKIRLSMANKPNVEPSGNVTEIKSVPMGSAIEIHHFDATGKATGSKTVKLSA